MKGSWAAGSWVIQEHTYTATQAVMAAGPAAVTRLSDPAGAWFVPPSLGRLFACAVLVGLAALAACVQSFDPPRGSGIR